MESKYEAVTLLVADEESLSPSLDGLPATSKASFSYGLVKWFSPTKNLGMLFFVAGVVLCTIGSFGELGSYSRRSGSLQEKFDDRARLIQEDWHANQSVKPQPERAGTVEGAPALCALSTIPWYTDAALFTAVSVLAALCVVPVVMAVDKAVTQAAAGMPLGRSLRVVICDMLTRPGAVVIPFGMVLGVYTLTYGASNLVDVVSERFELSEATEHIMKIVLATGAYTTSSILKDVAFAKMFSDDEPKTIGRSLSNLEEKRVVPWTVYGVFLFRDALIISAGFVLPAMVAPLVESATGMHHETAAKIAQLATPCFMQILITPIHLFGLNLYNTPTATVNERFRAIASTYPQATGVRMVRFLWAYGVGGLVNKELNHFARSWTVEHYCMSVSRSAQL